MSAAFQEISSAKPVTARNPLKLSLGNLRNVSSECLLDNSTGLRKVTADMKCKNRVDRRGVVSTTEKEPHTNTLLLPKQALPYLSFKWAASKML